MDVEPGNALLCAVTNLWMTCENAEDRQQRMRAQMQDWAARGVQFVQLREKALDAGELLALAVLALGAASGSGRRPLVLVNGRADVAVAAGADGVHLTGHPEELRPEQVRVVFRAAGRERCFVSVSCHALEEVRRAREGGADLIVFGPVFEKRVAGEVVQEGVGVELLRQAASLAGAIPVLALGGVTRVNGVACLRAGAAGFAGIRLFQRWE